MVAIGFGVVSGSAGSSITTVARRDETRGSISTVRLTDGTLDDATESECSDFRTNPEI
jgi:hypothetical protein